MSKVIYLSSRLGVELPWGEAELRRVLDRLNPAPLRPRPARIIAGPGTLIGIFNPVDGLPIEGESVCLGALFGPRADWWRPGAEVPDGSYALFRGDGETLELVSDIVGSRTIWYAQTEDLFIAATSQRAIVCFLQSFEPNEAVYPWMLSSGTLGPGLSWDRRIRCLGPDSRLRLNRRTWEVAVEQTPVEYVPEELPRVEHERRLRQALEETFAQLDLDPSRWVLPLSGGYDSRAILLSLKDRAGLRTVTWGLRSALEDRESDAWVARELARHFGLAHEYYETDLSAEPIEQIFERYLVAGEGRVDHISGYMDGFAIWRRLHESGCQGILRGDQAFGRAGGADDSAIRYNTGLTYLSDYKNLRDAGLPAKYVQELPLALHRRTGESQQQWNDRLFQSFRHPVILAALNDLKCAYVEMLNPLLSRTIVRQVRRIPDRLRTGKGLYRDIVRDKSPAIDFAERAAINPAADILKDGRIIGHITGHLHTDGARTLLGNALLEFIDMRLAQAGRVPTGRGSSGKALKRVLKAVFPTALFDAMRRLRGGHNKTTSTDIDIYRFAFRAYLICRMNVRLDQDAKLFKQSRAL